MTRFHVVTVPAAQLKLGDMFVGWAVPSEGIFGKGERILNIKEDTQGILTVYIPGEKFKMHPQHRALIEVIA